MNLPSIRTIETRLNLTREQARRIRRVMERSRANWSCQAVRRVLTVADRVTECHGSKSLMGTAERITLNT